MKNVLITGAASGIGYETAVEFGKAGYNLLLTDINEIELECAARKLSCMGINVKHELADVSNWSDVHAIAILYPNIDILINNAGIGHNGEMADMTYDVWERLIRVNLMGPIHHMCAFLPLMKKRKSGHIVNISSGQAFFRLSTWGAYAAFKMALGVISEVLAREVEKYNIKVTTVYPFMVNTPFYKEIPGDTLAAKLSMKLLPLYSNTPQEVAKIILKATEEGKKVEMVNILNQLGFAIRSFPPAANIVDYLSNMLLIKKE
jgi:short-subunit dehydrogenase